MGRSPHTRQWQRSASIRYVPQCVVRIPILFRLPHYICLESFPSFFPDPDDIDPHFEGCMRNLVLNGKEYPLTVEAGWHGLSIDDCDGTACGGEVCKHEGVCNLDEKHPDGYTCNCLEDFRGRNCEIHSLCEDSGGCQNEAFCRVESAEVKCDCPYGYLGDFCETGTYFLFFLAPM